MTERARLTLRIPPHLHAKILRASLKSREDVNTWITRALTDAVATADKPKETASS